MSRERMGKYIKCILVGLPIWYSIGILITLDQELGKELGIIGEIERAIPSCIVMQV